MKDDMKEALYEQDVGGSDFHTNIILEVIKDSKKRMLSNINTPSGVVSEIDSSGGLLYIRTKIFL